MKRMIGILTGITSVILLSSLSFQKYNGLPADTYTDSLRRLYSKPLAEWPRPFIDTTVQHWQELGLLPASPIATDSLQPLINLGKLLFFDPRLSGSGQISCATCHVPDLSWTDGREKAVGHDQQVNTRNTPTIFNVWFYKNLFWDGRSNSLEDQAFGPINSEIEMHGDMSLLPSKLEEIKGYAPLFKAAYGTETVDADKVAHALAIFQKTVVSRKSDFDYFLSGDKNRLTDAAVRGLHLFRTKARCMNCHNGPLFTDNDFHNIGLTYYGRKYEDLGRYNVTRKASDVGKFKTPSLRDVIRTRPWMHNGLFDNIEGVLNMYSAGMPQPKRKPEQMSDTLFPVTSPLIKRLDLTKQEKDDIIAFLNAITAEPWKMRIPVLPK
ncbi:cytochrome-c peroxidase [Filimonas effusa]|uniref:Methylamine utilization protein MauG n=1 Tax=Filimonas effusa TaxID=2508721 RepID=A0A4Q1D8N3_9BACT|nr:cytochrome c peroxidase [Filimonas effusa]RXK85651.1 cytochrome-c peroxidase [Filimonas effusa]